MRAARLFHLLTLAAFLPLASGCSSQNVIPLGSDPDTATAPLEAGKAITISGYTTTANGYQSWNGTVQTAPPDSLQFSRVITSGNAAPVEESTLTIARTDVNSLSVTDMHWGRTVALAFGAVVGISVLAALLSDPSYYGL